MARTSRRSTTKTGKEIVNENREEPNNNPDKNSRIVSEDDSASEKIDESEKAKNSNSEKTQKQVNLDILSQLEDCADVIPPSSQDLFDDANEADVTHFEDFVAEETKSAKKSQTSAESPKTVEKGILLKKREECFGPSSEDSFSEAEMRNMQKWKSSILSKPKTPTTVRVSDS